MALNGYYVKKLGQNKGAPRIWLEGALASLGGFNPGTRFDVDVHGRMVVLQANPDGTRVVSGKKIGEKTNPVIDLNSKELLAVFDGMAAVRIAVKDGEIFILPLASELKKQERFNRLREKLESGEPITIGSLSHGGGILSHAFHTGLASAGIESKLSFANEIRPELLEHARMHNDAWSTDTKVYAAPMQELAFDERGLASIPLVEGMEISLPCSGASPAGRSKKGLSKPEDHEQVGHLVVASLILLAKANPAIVLYENVPAYAESGSASILRNQLRDLGYETHEKFLNGKEWGALENRNRWCMVAVTQGIKFDFDQLVPPVPAERRLGDVLEVIPDDDPRWSRMQGLRDKEVRDKAQGKGFSMQIYSEDSDHVNTITKGYGKVRSTDPKLRNANNPDLLRQLTPLEHAAVKSIPPHLISGLSNTVAHEVLGQSIVFPGFRDVGQHIGNAMNAFAGRTTVSLANRTPLNCTELVSATGATMASEILASLTLANAEGGRYYGRVVVADGDVVIQDAGRGAGVVHQLDLLDDTPLLGASVDVVYSRGHGVVREVAEKGKALEAGISR
ncbi:DNA cytosine methyltransferase [Glaciimonas sp. GG7]